MSLVLYWNVASQPARAVKALLNIGKIPHQAITIDINNNETRTMEYLLKNPLGRIPFITEGEFKLAESNAILVYLCEKHPVLAKYYGNTITQRGLVNQHLSWYQNSFRPALFKIIYLKIYEGIKRQKPVFRSAVEAAEKEMESAMG